MSHHISIIKEYLAGLDPGLSSNLQQKLNDNINVKAGVIPILVKPLVRKKINRTYAHLHQEYSDSPQAFVPEIKSLKILQATDRPHRNLRRIIQPQQYMTITNEQPSKSMRSTLTQLAVPDEVGGPCKTSRVPSSLAEESCLKIS